MAFHDELESDLPKTDAKNGANVTTDSALYFDVWMAQGKGLDVAKTWKNQGPELFIPDTEPFKPIPGKGMQFSDLSKHLDETFKRIDKNNDGFLSKDEIKSAVADPSYKGESAMTIALIKANQSGSPITSMSWLSRDGEDDRPTKGVSLKDAKLYFGLLSLAQKENISNNNILNKLEPELTKPDFYKLIDPDNDKKITVKELQDASKTENLPKERKELVDLLLRNHSFLSKLDPDSDGTTISVDALSMYRTMNQTLGIMDEFTAHTMVERERITSEPKTKVFADETKPVQSIKLDAVKQGQVGDCFFLSAVGALAQSDPERLAKMITKTDTGEYIVRFPGAKGKEVTVPAPTETELILYAGATKYGAWVNMLEKAYGKLLIENPEFRGEGFIDKVSSPENLDGGGGSEALAMLTGEKPNDYKIEPNSEASLKALRERLAEAKKNGEIAIALSVFDDKIKPEMTPGHAYTVVDFDENFVSVRNTWGIKYQGRKDGLPHGRAGDDGITKIPIDKCADILYSISFVPGKRK